MIAPHRTRQFSRKAQKERRFDVMFNYEKLLCTGRNPDFLIAHPAEATAGVKGDFTEMKNRIKNKLISIDKYNLRKDAQRKGTLNE